MSINEGIVEQAAIAILQDRVWRFEAPVHSPELTPFINVAVESFQ